MTLRNGPAPLQMQMHPTSTAELEGLARAHGLEVLRVAASSDQGGRAGVTWDVVALKRDRLPSATAMANARDRIIRWWEAAYLDDEALRSRFLREAAAALPLSDGENSTAVYDALDWRRLRLWQDQHVPQWTPSDAPT